MSSAKQTIAVFCLGSMGLGMARFLPRAAAKAGNGELTFMASDTAEAFSLARPALDVMTGTGKD